MADHSASSAASQGAASASQHQRILLQKQLTEVRMENTILRQQLYQVSTLLDIAVSKLGTMGVSLETPIDIRALRTEALQRAHAETAQAQYNAIGASPESGKSPAQHHSKKFQMRQQLREHTRAVQCCAFSDSEDLLIATGGMDCRLIVQNYLSGAKLWDATAHEEAVSDVAWMNHNCLLSASYDNTVKLWDVNGGTTNKDVLYQYTTHGFVLSAIPLGPSLFACADSRHKTAIVDVRVGGKGMVQEHDYRINSLSYDEAAQQLLMGQSNGVVSIWDMRRPDQVLSTANSSIGGILPGSSSPPPPLPPQQHQHQRCGSINDMNGAVEGDAAPMTTLEDGAAGGSNIPGSNSGLMASGSANSVGGPPRFTRATEIENEPSRSPISFIAHFHSDDDTCRLLCVSGDNMVRLYRGKFSAFTGGGRKDGIGLYVLRNVLAGVPTRGNVMRCGFWKGERDKTEMSVFFDDGEMDGVSRPPRRLTECDLLVTGGPDNTAQVCDVTDDGGAVVLERLEGHRDRVTGATVRRSRKPIIATMSADSTVRIWMPVKS
ncbi:WD domain, G-beta repeat, putative [Leishmania donovani]|uniref:WD domain, G-beta repeat, putative n=1 Tax=Leishmania donovani TaxID=5661 RepID=A0A3Q8IUQ4_LEIDO|nr:WD domain, G-beta repeat, putative [Leishmania donovani]